MMRQKLVHGVGINDADYVVQVKKVIGVNSKGKKIVKYLEYCPYYIKWVDMLRRCYSLSHQKKYPAYNGCSTVPEWHYFMTFKAWMEKQDWEGKELDKDLLIQNNKIYGPDTCIFLDQSINKFIKERSNTKNEYSGGASFHKRIGKFQAQGWDILTGKRKGLGYFDSKREAQDAWLAHKLEQAKILASWQTDSRLAKALIERYENYVYQD